jgi:hypothetical protein
MTANRKGEARAHTLALSEKSPYEINPLQGFALRMSVEYSDPSACRKSLLSLELRMSME